MLALALAACASGAQAPISYGGSASSPSQSAGRASRAAPAAPPRVRAPTPEPNWAAGPGTPLSAYALRPEDVQPFDPANPPRSVRLGANQSLYDVAVAYQVPLRALIEQNNLSPPFALRPGQEIELPPPRLHRVARGESFEDVARAYNVDLRSLALLNRMRPPYNVRPGDVVVLPAMARAWVSAPAPVDAETPPAGDGPLAWPLRGGLLARFGAQSDGRRIDGIEIAADEGARAGAAEAGDVVYAGADLPAYGALVLVRHADGYVTAYGYGRRALVREGERVRRGQALIEIGRHEGGAARLLFQVRRGTQAVDPLPLLGSS